MEYRKASLGDAERIAKVLVDNFSIPTIQKGKEIFIREKQKVVFIVAEDDGRILGFITWFARGEPRHELVRIERIGVLAGSKRDEVAEGLITAAIQDADKFFKSKGMKLRKIYTLVNSKQIKLKNFYKNKGFIEEAQIKDHYNKGEDEFILSMFFE